MGMGITINDQIFLKIAFRDFEGTFDTGDDIFADAAADFGDFTFQFTLARFPRITANDAAQRVIGNLQMIFGQPMLLKLLFDSDTITRIGGGAFIILLSRVAKSEDAENVATKLLTAFKAPFP